MVPAPLDYGDLEPIGLNPILARVGLYPLVLPQLVRGTIQSSRPVRGLIGPDHSYARNSSTLAYFAMICAHIWRHSLQDTSTSPCEALPFPA